MSTPPTPSRSCEIADPNASSPRRSAPPRQPSRDRNARRARAAFSLLETLIVLVILGLTAALVAASIGAGARVTRERAAVTAVLDALWAARTQALSTAAPVRLVLRAEPGHLAWTKDALPARRVAADGLVPIDQLSRPAQLDARFAPSGRTDAQSWRITSTPPASGTAPVRIWRIDFDPISGAPALFDPSLAAAIAKETRP